MFSKSSKNVKKRTGHMNLRSPDME